MCNYFVWKRSLKLSADLNDDQFWWKKKLGKSQRLMKESTTLELSMGFPCSLSLLCKLIWWRVDAKFFIKWAIICGQLKSLMMIVTNMLLLSNVFNVWLFFLIFSIAFNLRLFIFSDWTGTVSFEIKKWLLIEIDTWVSNT